MDPLSAVDERMLRPKRVRKKFRISFSLRSKSVLKKFVWRVTATLAWIHILAHWYSHKGHMFYPERYCMTHLETGLAAVAFSPSNQYYFPIFLKLAWIITISGFSFIESMWFVLLYVPFFPFSVGFLIFKGDLWHKEILKNRSKRGLGQAPSTRSHTMISAAAMLAWLLLYGQAQAHAIQLVGVAIAGLILFQRSVSAFSFAGSVEEARSSVVDGLVLFNISLNSEEPIDPAKADTVVGLKISGFLFRRLYRILRILYSFTRGKRGRNRVAMFVLIQYVWSLALLGAVAVFFWSLVIRLKTIGLTPTIDQSFLASASRVLPGLAAPFGIKLPLWVDAGSSITAWILFVVYAGPAASVFPNVQGVYVRLFSDAHLVFRSAGVKAMLRTRDIDGRIQRLLSVDKAATIRSPTTTA